MLATPHSSARPLTSAYAGDTRLVWLPDAKPSRVAYWGAPQTIDVMAKAVLEDAGRFDTRRLVEAFCEQLDSKDYTSEYLAAYYFLLARARYMRDPRTTELVKAPYRISQQMLAGHRPSIDCDDMSTWLASATLAMGGRAEFVTVAFSSMLVDGERQYSHVFVRVLEPRSGVKIVLDPVAAEKTAQMLKRVRYYDVWPIAA